MNPPTTEALPPLTVRRAGPADAPAVWRLLDTGARTHLHPDWRPVTDWLGRSPAFVAESASGLAGCLITSVDPAPAAWIRAAAVAVGLPAQLVMRRIVAPCLSALADQGTEFVSAMPTEPWLTPILAELGFVIVEQVETWRKLDLNVPRFGATDVTIRPAELDDIQALAEIDRRAFEPRWRSSTEALTLAYQQAATFTVARRDARLVGFQISLSDRLGAHLARLTVHPDAQRSGVGSRLLADALERVASVGLSSVSLNTQVENIPSHRLYAAFGFLPLSPPVPVWERRVQAYRGTP